MFAFEYNGLSWSENQDHWDAWKDGKTGFPIIDAGMRELNQTGFMHNRIRMMVASFWSKICILTGSGVSAILLKSLLIMILQ